MGKKEENLRYFNAWAKLNYDFAPFQWWMTHFQQPVFKSVEKNKPLTFLDVSCGTGKLIQKLLTFIHPKSKVYGLDFSKEMLKKARQRLPKKVILKEGDVHNLPFRQNTFDMTVTTESFHHYTNQEEAIQELARVTKRNGVVMVVDIHFIFSFINRIFEKLEPGCGYINSKKETKTLFEQAGLQVLKQERSFVFAIITLGKKV